MAAHVVQAMADSLPKTAVGAPSASHPASSSVAPSLLLLPPPPRPASRALVNAAYRDSLAAVLTRISRQYAKPSSGKAPVLVVAVVGPFLSPSPHGPSEPCCVRWWHAQALLAELYTIVVSVCAEREITIKEPWSVDVRVILISQEEDRSSVSARFNRTTVLDLASFAAVVRPWKTIFHPSSEPGYDLLSAYLLHTEGRHKFSQHQSIAVEGGISLFNAGINGRGSIPDWGTRRSDKCVRGYSTACLGGTFDHLHVGHKMLLAATVLLLHIPDHGSPPSTIIVGVSGGPLLVDKEYAEQIQSWDDRARSVIAFASTLLDASATEAVSATSTLDPTTSARELKATFCYGSVIIRCVELHDPFGPTVSEETIEAIVVSSETRRGANVINEKRAACGWRPLDIFEIGLLENPPSHSTSSGADQSVVKISSTDIRKHRARFNQDSVAE